MKLSGAGAENAYLIISAPDPAKKYGSGQLRLRNTALVETLKQCLEPAVAETLKQRFGALLW